MARHFPAGYESTKEVKREDERNERYDENSPWDEVLPVKTGEWCLSEEGKRRADLAAHRRKELDGESNKRASKGDPWDVTK